MASIEDVDVGLGHVTAIGLWFRLLERQVVFTPLFNDACLRDADCILVHRQTDCCGSRSNLAVNNGEAAAFAAAEAKCEAQYPACGCAGQSPPAATAACVDTRCEVITTGSNGFACGTQTCSLDQYCTVNTPGAGGMSSYSCVTGKNCASDCVYCKTPQACTCSALGGQVQIQCNGV